MIKIINVSTGAIIAAYNMHPIPEFEKINPNASSQTPEAQVILRERFKENRVKPALAHNAKVRRDIAEVLKQCHQVIDIDTGDTDCYCPPDTVYLNN